MNNEKKNITIIGTGAYGTALANVLTDNDHNVIMYGVDIIEINDINENQQNHHFFGRLKINKEIKATNNFQEAVQDAEYIILGVPVVAFASTIEKINQYVKHPVIIINVAKGLDPITYQVLSRTIEKLIQPAIFKGYGGIYGPSIAVEVLQRKPACLMAVAIDWTIAKEIASLFKNEYFVTFPDNDVVGAEYAAALKNSIAIASGIFYKLTLSDSAKASLITMGLNEIKLFGKIKGANVETFLNFAGLADLILTASSEKSRNYALGVEIAQTDDAKKVLEQNAKTVEGVLTCQTIVFDARANNLYLPLFEALYEILFIHKKPSIVMTNILSRAIIK